MAQQINRREMLLGTVALAARLPVPQYRIIDPHVHVWVNDPRYPWAKQTTAPPNRDATPEMLLALMKANDVARTVLVQVIYYRLGQSLCRRCAEEVSSALSRASAA